jgi:hypothetical protein
MFVAITCRFSPHHIIDSHVQKRKYCTVDGPDGVLMKTTIENITMIVMVSYSRVGVESKLDKIWLGSTEVPVAGRSIAQCLEEMSDRGWNLIRSRAIADYHGIVCEYDFWREVSVPQSDVMTSEIPQRPL